MDAELYAIKECKALVALAEADENYTHKCVNGEPVFYYEYDRALIPGHIYSGTGLAEYRISRACEYHFDMWFKDEE